LSAHGALALKAGLQPARHVARLIALNCALSDDLFGAVQIALQAAYAPFGGPSTSPAPDRQTAHGYQRRGGQHTAKSAIVARKL
jgi:hypothetical protein